MTPRQNRIFEDPDLLGLAEAERNLSEPLRRTSSEFPSQGEVGHPALLKSRRKAEIVMVLPRPEGVLVHTKSFYPTGTLRLPTGGVRGQEPILAAARREVLEETGLTLEPHRFLFHLCHVRPGPRLRLFHSLAFLYPLSREPMAPTDPEERISELRPVAWTEIPGIIRFLEGLKGVWHTWGRFRAAAHRVLLDCRAEHAEWFDENP